jgi:hypothetical protein
MVEGICRRFKVEAPATLDALTAPIDRPNEECRVRRRSRAGPLHAVQGLFRNAGLSVQAQPSGRFAVHQLTDPHRHGGRYAKLSHYRLNADGSPIGPVRFVECDDDAAAPTEAPKGEGGHEIAILEGESLVASIPLVD